MADSDGGHAGDNTDLPLAVGADADADADRDTRTPADESGPLSPAANEHLVAETPSSHTGSDSYATTPRSSWWNDLLSNTWLFESVAIAFSLACLIAVAAVLRACENRSSHPMPYGITLNAIVSTLATASKTSLLCAVAASIGQLKWDWFEKPRDLYDLQAFDDVSRGPTGALIFLYRRYRNKLVALGATIILLTLLFDPFVQQIIRYRNRIAETSQGSAQTRKAYNFPTDSFAVEFIAAINAGVCSKPNQFFRVPHCSSERCEWDTFDSFGWCSKCQDVTAQAELFGQCDVNNWSENATCWLSFDSGSSVVIARGIPSFPHTSGVILNNDVIWSLGWHETPSTPFNRCRDFNTSHMGIQNPPVSIGYASVKTHNFSRSQHKSNAPGIKLTRAEQCVLAPCIQTCKIRTHLDTLKAEVVSTNYGTIKHVKVQGAPSDSKDEFNTLACWQPNKTDVKYSRFWEPSNRASVGCDGDASACDWWNQTESAFCPITSYGQAIETSLIASGHTQNL